MTESAETEILEIVQAGHPVLRRVARALSVDEIRGRAVQDLIAQMRETMRAAPGVGLAAPQVALPWQLVVIEDRAEYQQRLTGEELAARNREPVPFHVLINPELIVVDTKLAEFDEGCLSIRGYMAKVPRARSVRVSALDHQGNSVDITAVGWYARILQHEIDHLNGMLYIDRMDSRTFASTT